MCVAVGYCGRELTLTSVSWSVEEFPQGARSLGLTQLKQKTLLGVDGELGGWGQ